MYYEIVFTSQILILFMYLSFPGKPNELIFFSQMGTIYLGQAEKAFQRS